MLDFIKIKSFIIKKILQLKGIKIGKNFLCKAKPALRIIGKYSNVIIGDNVSILGKIDLRNRGEGKIIIKNNVKIEEWVRIVTGNNNSITIDQNTIITRGCIINGGGLIFIGKNCIIGPYNVINANDHRILRKDKIINRKFVYGNVVMEDDCWTGAFVSVTKNVTIKKGSIIGAHSYVNKSTEKFSVNFGVPSKKFKTRD
jgi:acetyltransferase-like isoleucine patch superfamily enzyme